MEFKTCKYGHRYEATRKQCNVCRTEYFKKYRTENKDYYNEYNARWMKKRRKAEKANEKWLKIYQKEIEKLLQEI